MKSHTPKGRETHDQIVSAAEHLFAARGFHATSTRDVAAAAGIPLASLVYHFARKEQLYGAVLDGIAAALAAATASDEVDGFVAGLLDWATTNREHVTLLLRELLDNPTRVASAGKLPLAPFLARGVALLADAGVANPELALLHLVGGASYVVAAWPTVTRIVGAPRARQLADVARAEATAFADRVLGRTHERRPRTPADPPRARPPRTRNDRRRPGTVDPARRRVS